MKRASCKGIGIVARGRAECAQPDVSRALATVARLISEGRGVQAGVHFLADAVDAETFMAELRTAGVELIEKLDNLSIA